MPLAFCLYFLLIIITLLLWVLHIKLFTFSFQMKCTSSVTCLRAFSTTGVLFNCFYMLFQMKFKFFSYFKDIKYRCILFFCFTWLYLWFQMRCTSFSHTCRKTSSTGVACVHLASHLSGAPFYMKNCWVVCAVY